MGTSIIEDFTKETIDLIYYQTKKKNNKKKIKYVIDTLTSMLLANIHPYLYTILAILIVMFLMNCFQFFYYVKVLVNKNINFNLDTMSVSPQ